MFAFLRGMSQSDTKHTSPTSLVVDAVLVVLFFAVLFHFLKPHVPSNDPFMINAWGAIATSCLTGVFWLCIQMFRVVLRAQRAAARK